MKLRRFHFHSPGNTQEMEDQINKTLEGNNVDLKDVIGITVVPGLPNLQGPMGCDRYTVWYRKHEVPKQTRPRSVNELTYGEIEFED